MVRSSSPCSWFSLALLSLALFIISPTSVDAQVFRRGDVNDDGQISLFDVCLLSDHLFMGTPIPCPVAADVDDDNALSTSDVTFLLNFLCTPAAPPPPPPGPIVCGPDPTPGAFPPCAYASCPTVTLPPNSRFIRGDCDLDLVINIADAIVMLSVLFSGVPAPPCRDACDANDDGSFDLGDVVYLLNFLFVAGPPPPAPFPGCGCDPTECDGLDCVSGPCP